MPEKRVGMKKLALQPPVPGPHIEGHSVAHCDATCTIILDNILLASSPTDYRLTLLLLQAVAEKRKFVPFEELIQCFDSRQGNLRRRLYQHIYEIKPRLWQFGLDIISLREMGYVLVQT
jgi:hypothetical protein